MSDWKEFFQRHKDYVVNASYYECKSEFSLEDMYQAFRARLLDELMSAASGIGEDDFAVVIQRATDLNGVE